MNNIDTTCVIVIDDKNLDTLSINAYTGIGQALWQYNTCDKRITNIKSRNESKEMYDLLWTDYKIAANGQSIYTEDYTKNVLDEITDQAVDNKAPIKSFEKEYPQINNLILQHDSMAKDSVQVELFGNFILNSIHSKEYSLVDVLLKTIDSLYNLNTKKYNESVLLAIISLSAHIKRDLTYWDILKNKIKPIFIEKYGSTKANEIFRGVEA